MFRHLDFKLQPAGILLASKVFLKGGSETRNIGAVVLVAMCPRKLGPNPLRGDLDSLP